MLSSLIMFSVVQGFYINNDLVFDDNYDDRPISFRTNLHMNISAGVFLVLFAAIGCYLAHYVHFDSPQVINNSYVRKL